MSSRLKILIGRDFWQDAIREKLEADGYDVHEVDFAWDKEEIAALVSRATRKEEALEASNRETIEILIDKMAQFEEVVARKFDEIEDAQLASSAPKMVRQPETPRRAHQASEGGEIESIVGVNDPLTTTLNRGTITTEQADIRHKWFAAENVVMTAGVPGPGPDSDQGIHSKFPDHMRSK